MVLEARSAPLDSGRSRDAGLDLLRTWAITLVFLYHGAHEARGSFGGPVWQFFTEIGWTGVDLFFVLSGFLIGEQLICSLRKRDDGLLTEFYARRAFRILPLYLFTLSVSYWVETSRGGELPPLWRFLTFTQNLFLSGPAPLLQTWSLCVEEHFYLFFPLIAIGLQRLRVGPRTIGSLLVGLLMAQMGLRAGIWLHFHEAPWPDLAHPTYLVRIFFPTYTRLDGLAVGVGLACLKVLRPGAWAQLLSRPRLLLLTFASLSIAAWWGCHHRHSLYGGSVGLTALALAYGTLLTMSVGLRFERFPFLARVGESGAALAYPIYLTHQQIIAWSGNLAKGAGLALNSPIRLLAMTAASIGVAWVLHRAIERPMLGLRRRFLARGTKPAVEDVLARAV